MRYTALCRLRNSNMRRGRDSTMADGQIHVTGTITRRKVLALSAAASAGVALAACGGTTSAPTNTPARAVASPTAAAPATAPPPAATATAVPQSLGGSPTAASGSATSAASSAVAPNATSAPTAAASAANLADKQIFRFADTEPISFDPANCQNPVNEPQVFEGLVVV